MLPLKRSASFKIRNHGLVFVIFDSTFELSFCQLCVCYACTRNFLGILHLRRKLIVSKGEESLYLPSNGYFSYSCDHLTKSMLVSVDNVEVGQVIKYQNILDNFQEMLWRMFFKKSMICEIFILIKWNFYRNHSNFSLFFHKFYCLD